LPANSIKVATVTPLKFTFPDQLYKSVFTFNTFFPLNNAFVLLWLFIVAILKNELM